MWTFSVAHQHKLLLVWTRRWQEPASLPGVASQFASYRVSAALLRPEDRRDRSVPPGAKGRRRVLNTSSVPHQSVASDGRQHAERSAQTRGWRHEPPVLQAADQRRGGGGRVSSELRKLCLEDLPAERERPGRRSPALDYKAEDYEIVFGVSPCLLALTQGRRKARRLFVKDEEASQRTSVLTVCEEAHRRGVQVQRVSKRDLDKMSSGRVHQGLCLQASPLSYLTEDFAPSRTDGSAPLWLVLEKIQDPMNLGAILRSAYFLGVDRVASSLHHSCPLSPVVSKASSGVMEAMGVYGYESLREMVKGKVAQGWQVVGTVGSEAGPPQIPVAQCSDFRMTKPTLLLMGSEGDGLSQQLLSLCQTLLTIPAGRQLSPGIESLNVSVATGILLHSLLSSR